MSNLPSDIDFDLVESPSYLIDERKIIGNLAVLKRIKEEAGVTIISALKAFALPWACDYINQYLDGYTSSSIDESTFAYEFGKGPIHLYAPAFSESLLKNMLNDRVSHVTFNSISQWEQHKEQIINKHISAGIRINPLYAEIEKDIYNPASKSSRLGIPIDHLENLPEGIEGVHIHALCENDSQTLERLLNEIREKGKGWLRNVKWINLGGGHGITQRSYDVDHLIEMLIALKGELECELILEPGAAIAWEAGYLISEVLDVIPSEGKEIAMLNVSFAAHMPDCLEMPYKPFVIGAIQPNELFSTYVLGGNTCLAGDQIGDYSFIKPLKIGDKVVFYDMLHYTFVKNTSFNGVKKPSLLLWDKQDEIKTLKRFDYHSFRSQFTDE